MLSINMQSKISSYFTLFLIFAVGFLSSTSIVYLNLLRKKNSSPAAEKQKIPIPTSSKSKLKNNKKEIIGFLPSWNLSQNAQINTKNLTQLIYFGLSVNENGEIVKYKADGVPVLEWKYFTSKEFKKHRQTVKTLLALKNFDNESIDNLISNQTAVNRLIKQTDKLISEYDLDGINIDFEYVTRTDFPTAKYFNRFLKTFAAELKQKYPELVISIDINAVGVTKDPAYDLVRIGELADQVILMGYDFHKANSYNAGPVAPLEEDVLEQSVGKAVRSLKGRVPYEKLILGIPFYGYEWQTVNRNYKSITVQNTGSLATYRRIRELIEGRDDLQINWEEKTKSPWLVYIQNGAIKQIYYENDKSISAKAAFVREQNLAGIAIWALGYEGNYTQPWEAITNNL